MPEDRQCSHTSVWAPDLSLDDYILYPPLLTIALDTLRHEFTAKLGPMQLFEAMTSGNRWLPELIAALTMIYYNEIVGKALRTSLTSSTVYASFSSTNPPLPASANTRRTCTAAGRMVPGAWPSRCFCCPALRLPPTANRHSSPLACAWRRSPSTPGDDCPAFHHGLFNDAHHWRLHRLVAGAALLLLPPPASEQQQPHAAPRFTRLGLAAHVALRVCSVRPAAQPG